MTYTLTIPGWHPVPKNRLIGCHWTTKHRKKRCDRELVAVYAKLQDIPKATGKRRCALTITLGPGERGCDPDAYWLSLLDALVACGLLADDGPRWCELVPVVYERGESRETKIELEDIDQ